MKNIFFQRLKELRIENGLTQKEFGALIGATKNQISSWERHKTEPEIDILCKICTKFDVRTNYMLGIDNIKHRKKDSKF